MIWIQISCLISYTSDMCLKLLGSQRPQSKYFAWVRKPRLGPRLQGYSQLNISLAQKDANSLPKLCQPPSCSSGLWIPSLRSWMLSHALGALVSVLRRGCNAHLHLRPWCEQRPGANGRGALAHGGAPCPASVMGPKQGWPYEICMESHRRGRRCYCRAIMQKKHSEI